VLTKKPGGQIKGNRSKKYSGSGYVRLQKIPPNYVHWDNVNELVERLQLLMASRAAGNNNHTNEILSIIEELREAKIIH